MKKNWKLLIALLMVTAMLMSAFTGCADKDEQTPQATKASESTAAEATQAPVMSSEYGEAPELADMVANGELPSVEERLPEEPCVVNAAEIGQYGGVFKGAGFGPSHGQLDTEGLRFVNLLQIEEDLSTFTPSILKDYEANDDFTVWTWYLREGMKWSDGAPFTADDFIFWYEDIILNEELTPTISAAHKTGEDVMVMEKVDDYTVTVTFAAPNKSFDITMAKSFWNGRFFAPKHYLEQFHIKYNTDAEANAKADGYETWWQAFNAHYDTGQTQIDVTRPEVVPWVLYQIDDVGNKYYKRNAYYWKVDAEGNQLPYIDEQHVIIVQDAQMRVMKLISGEIHNAGENPLPIKDYTLYKENEEKGDYKVFLFDNTRGSDSSFTFNLNTNNEDLRPIFNDLKFRQAMSLAINRQEMNDVLYFGKANIRQAAPPANTTFFKDWMETYLTEYDTARANELLDEAGLTWNADKTARLLPNGEPIKLILETTEEFVPMSEMVAEYWTAVGVETILKQQERTFFQERGPAGERDVQSFTFDSVSEFSIRSDQWGKMRPFQWGNLTLDISPKWRIWEETNGADGMEPPQELIDLRDRMIAFGELTPGSDEYLAEGEAILTQFIEGTYYIGTTVAPRVIIISNKLGNTPAEGTFAGDYMFWFPYKGDAWYFK